MKTLLSIIIILCASTIEAQEFKGKNYINGSLSFSHYNRTDNNFHENKSIGLDTIYIHMIRSNNKNTNRSLNFGLSFGRFISESFAIGISAGINNGRTKYENSQTINSVEELGNQRTTESFGYNAGVQILHRVRIISKLDFYSRLSGHYSSGYFQIKDFSNKYRNESTSLNIDCGLQYLLAERFLINTSLVGIGYTHVTKGTPVKNLNFRTLDGFSFGFSYLW